jgi:hypothetical protein
VRGQWRFLTGEISAPVRGSSHYLIELDQGGRAQVHNENLELLPEEKRDVP